MGEQFLPVKDDLAACRHGHNVPLDAEIEFAEVHAHLDHRVVSFGVDMSKIDRVPIVPVDKQTISCVFFVPCPLTSRCQIS